MRLLLCSGSSKRVGYFERALRESAHSVSRAGDVAGATWLLRQEDFDAVLLFSSASMEETETAEYTTQIRSVVQSRSPSLWHQPLIFVLCEVASPMHRTRLLRAGADACFCEPIYFAEVEARLRSFRRHVTSVEPETPPPAAERIAWFPERDVSADHAMVQREAPRLDEDLRALCYAGTRLDLSVREYLFIACLMQQAPHPVPHERLLQYCWYDNEDVLRSVVGQTALRLRRRLQAAAMPLQIASVPRFGYRLIGES